MQSAYNYVTRPLPLQIGPLHLSYFAFFKTFITLISFSSICTANTDYCMACRQETEHIRILFMKQSTTDEI